MILYLDSSAILSVYLAEPGRHVVVQAVIELADSIVSSMIALVEVRAGLARARFKESPPRLSDAGYRRSLSRFAGDWPSYGRLGLSEEITQEAAELTEKHLLRAYDAVHLAAALLLQRRMPDKVAISTWDIELAKAATAEGVALTHES